VGVRCLRKVFLYLKLIAKSKARCNKIPPTFSKIVTANKKREMRYLTLFVFHLLISSLSAQNYPNLEQSSLINQEKNNQILKPGLEYSYSYRIFDNKTQQRLYLEIGTEAEWNLVEIKDSANMIEKLNMLVIKPKVFKKTNKRQTEIIYSYTPDWQKFSSTGGIENKNNFWLHPPRTDYFKILEICPFPYVKFPLHIGKEWNDENKVSSTWSDLRWLEWKGNLNLKFNYKIVGKKQIKTKLQSYDCWVIESSTISQENRSRLVSYFNENAGFVKMEYKTINNLTIEFELDNIEKFNSEIQLEQYIAEKMSYWR